MFTEKGRKSLKSNDCMKHWKLVEVDSWNTKKVLRSWAKTVTVIPKQILEATFMRMKDDHMMNGQLKPAYNVQIAVENYFIIHSYVSNDRTDYNTLIPIVEKHIKAFGEILKETTADSGYCSEKNLLFLKEHHIESYIKLQEHEQRKTRAYKEQIGKYYNMELQDF